MAYNGSGTVCPSYVTIFLEPTGSRFFGKFHELSLFFQVIALKVKRGGDWKTWTYERYLREVQLAARGFIHIGLTRHHSVAIMGNNTPEWVISDLAAIFAG